MSIKNRGILAFVLICVFSLGFHVFLVKKKALRTLRYPIATPGQVTPTPEEGMVVGTVSSASAGRFFVRVGERQMEFQTEGQIPALGSQVRVFYTAVGVRRTATRIETQ